MAARGEKETLTANISNCVDHGGQKEININCKY